MQQHGVNFLHPLWVRRRHVNDLITTFEIRISSLSKEHNGVQPEPPADGDGSHDVRRSTTDGDHNQYDADSAEVLDQPGKQVLEPAVVGHRRGHRRVGRLRHRRQSRSVSIEPASYLGHEMLRVRGAPAVVARQYLAPRPEARRYHRKDVVHLWPELLRASQRQLGGLHQGEEGFVFGLVLRHVRRPSLP